MAGVGLTATILAIGDGKKARARGTGAMFDQVYQDAKTLSPSFWGKKWECLRLFR